ncbi:MAG: DUF3106 domain-containing protein [Planctomycetes bacterium]|jgi:hypothetical protein|nr:DUF3106 domain-containing protein [Planctomycetota bacterium]
MTTHAKRWFARKVMLVPGACLLVAIIAAGAFAQGADQSRQQQVGIASQLRLLARIRALSEGKSLAAALDNNRSEWNSLSPEERDKLRTDALAFLNADPDNQRVLVERYQQIIAMSAQRRQKYQMMAEWVDAVTRSFSEQERRELLASAPEVRARRLLARRAELIASGVLSAHYAAPATSPASAPATTRPASGD